MQTVIKFQFSQKFNDSVVRLFYLLIELETYIYSIYSVNSI